MNPLDIKVRAVHAIQLNINTARFKIKPVLVGLELTIFFVKNTVFVNGNRGLLNKPVGDVLVWR